VKGVDEICHKLNGEGFFKITDIVLKNDENYHTPFVNDNKILGKNEKMF